MFTLDERIVGLGLHPLTREIKYIGAFLGHGSRVSLLSVVQPVHQHVFAEHITLVHSPKPGDVDAFADLIGRYVTVYAKDAVFDGAGQAVTCVVNAVLPTAVNRKAHITVSCAEHIEPSYSNSILTLKGRPISNLEMLSARIGLMMSDGRVEYELQPSTFTFTRDEVEKFLMVVDLVMSNK